MNIEGSKKGKKVKGLGYIERHGFVNSSNMKEFLKAVSSGLKYLYFRYSEKFV